MKQDMDFSRAFGRADGEFVRMVENTVEQMKHQEEKKMKKKFPAMVIIVAALIVLAVGTAFALTVGWRHIEQAMDLAVENGDYADWSLEAKMKLMEAMREDGISIADGDWNALTGNDLTEKEKHALADRILTGYYGDREFLYYFTIADAEWGDQRAWTLEQKHWFWNTLREKGLYGDDYWIDLLPDEGDLTVEQAVSIAKRAAEEAWGLTEGEMDEYEAYVSFFKTQDHETPRWQVEFSWHGREGADYTVLLDRDGRVTDGEDIGVVNPKDKIGREKQGDTEDSQSIPRQWLEDADSVYFNPDGGKHYHYLSDCPGVREDHLPLSALKTSDEKMARLTPCPCCVSCRELWSVQDKAKYGIACCQTPGADWITAEEAIQRAKQALEAQGYHLENLRPGVRADDETYGVSFYWITGTADGSEWRYQAPYYAAVDGKTGEVIAVGENDGNG